MSQRYKKNALDYMTRIERIETSIADIAAPVDF